jgi:hypothetical protein
MILDTVSLTVSSIIATTLLQRLAVTGLVLCASVSMTVSGPKRPCSLVWACWGPVMCGLVVGSLSPFWARWRDG